MNIKSLPFVPTFLVAAFAMFVVAIAGPVVYDSAFCKATAYEILSKKLREDFPDKVQAEDFDQGKHVAAVYKYGTTGDVIQWYFQTKWKYTGQ